MAFPFDDTDNKRQKDSQSKKGIPDTFCKVFIRGLLVAQPRTANEGTPNKIAEFVVQTTPAWRPNEKPEFHTVVVYGKGADIVSRATPGCVIIVDGYLRSYEFTDMETGKVQHKVKVIGDFVHVAHGTAKYVSEIESIIDNNIR